MRSQFRNQIPSTFLLSCNSTPPMMMIHEIEQTDEQIFVRRTQALLLYFAFGFFSASSFRFDSFGCGMMK